MPLALPVAARLFIGGKNYGTRIATFGPKQPEVMKLLPDLLAVPGLGGVSTGLSLAQALAGDFADLNAQAELLLQYPGMKLRVSMHATPAPKDRGYQFFTVPLRPFGPETAVPTDIAAMWGANLVDDMCLGFANLHANLTKIGVVSQLEGYNLGGVMSPIGDGEFSLCSSNRKPYQDLSSIILASGPATYAPEKVVEGLTQIASQVSALRPGLLNGMCFFDPAFLSLGGHFDGGAFAISILQSMHAAAFAQGCKLGVMYQSIKNGRAIPAALTELAGLCDGMLL